MEAAQGGARAEERRAMRHVNVVADIGINHNGDLKIAKKLAWDAKCAGVDFVKLQKRNPESCYTPEELSAPCKSPWGDTVRDKVYGRELSWKAISEFDEYCQSIDLPWSASCFDLGSYTILAEKYPNRPWDKVASCMSLDWQFLCEVARRKKLTLISTGLVDDKKLPLITRMFQTLNCQYVLNHCVAKYPTKAEECNMECMHWVGHFVGHPLCVAIGYSGHSIVTAPSVMAVALGATWVEHHITYDHAAYGADHVCSFTGEEFKHLVDEIRVAEVALGSGVKDLTGKEKIPVRISTPWPKEFMVM